MTLEPGTRVGPYEVVSLIGAGGMGEVYRAHDPRLARTIAIKILPPAFLGDPLRLARFTRETKAIGALNHPNIVGVFDTGTHEGQPYLVMEFLDGQTLRDRITSGCSVDEALDYAVQMADGLAAAHTVGILHRDLKPENVFVAGKQRVKILDFGLAKTTAPVSASLATQTTPMWHHETAPGTVLGTPGYMSPEQVLGKQVDHRSDLFSFGIVLVEMLAGKSPFQRDSAVETMHAIVRDQPRDLAAVAGVAGDAVRDIVKRCLAKAPDERFQSASDLAFSLRGSMRQPSAIQRTHSKRAVPWDGPGVAVLASLCVVLAVAAAIGWLRVRSSPVLPAWATGAVELTVPLDAGSTLERFQPAVSPDGSQVAWVATQKNEQRIWVYSLQSGSARALPGTEGAAGPFWAIDGRSIGFFRRRKLQAIELDTSEVKDIIDTSAQADYGGSWSAGDIILLSERDTIVRTTAAGAAPKVVAHLDPALQENSLRYPVFLPDGRHFLYVARSHRPKQSSVYVGSLDGPAKRLFPTMTSVSYSNGHLLYGLNGRLVARRFDLNTFVAGDAVNTVATDLAANVNQMDGNFSVSTNGNLAYYRGDGFPQRELWWVDRKGRPLGQTAVAAGAIYTFRLSRDATMIAFDIINAKTGGRNVWIQRAGEGTPTRITYDEGDDWTPVLSPEGQQVAFMTYRNGRGDIYTKSFQGSGMEQSLVVSPAEEVPIDWSPDGRFLIYNTGGGVFAVPVGGSSAGIRSAEIKIANGARGRISPDSTFIVYDSDETGMRELYIQPFPTGPKRQVTNGGGAFGAWSAGGRELIYRRGRALMSVAVRASASEVRIEQPVHLFDLPVGGGFDPAPDGQRILIDRALPDERRLQLLLNWPARLAAQSAPQR